MSRVEGPAKSRGEPSFAADFGPREVEGWDTTEVPLEAILVCSRTLEHKILPWDDTKLLEAVRPDLVFQPSAALQATLNGDKGKLRMFATVNEVPDWFGQPIAIAYYADYEASFFANQYLRELSQFEGAYLPDAGLARRFSLEDDMEAWMRLQMPEQSTGASSYLKTRDLRPAKDIDLSVLKPQSRGIPAKVQFINPGKPNDNETAEEKEARQVKEQKAEKDAWAAFNAVKDAMAKPAGVYTHQTRTMLGDNAFLEPEAGLAWYQASSATLHLKLGSQQISGDVGNARQMLKDYFGLAKTPDGKEITIKAYNHDMGGAFGGRNGSLFAYYLAIAAVHANGRPVRLRWDRFQQFLLGLKRHSSVVRSSLKIDPATNKFEALESYMVLGAGAHANLTGAIVTLGTLHLTGPYRIPMTSLHGIASLRPHTPCGPSRGFGIPQACLHIETLVDRAASAIGIDAIELRKKNLFEKGNEDPSGYALGFHVANREVLERAARHQLWQNRDKERAARHGRGVAYGVGFAVNMEAYGASSDAVFGAVQVTPEGRVIVYADVSEMGQGSRTTLALVIEELLGLAPGMEEIQLSSPALFDALAKNFPRSGSTASRTAFVHLHPIREACALLMEHGFKEAARLILGLAILPTGVSWKDGALEVPGRGAIPRKDLIARMLGAQLWTGVKCHALFKNGWQAATLMHKNGQSQPLFLDALEIQLACDAAWNPQALVLGTVAKGAPQRSVYASAGHLVEIEIDRASGQLTVLSCHSILDAGDVISLPIVEGQAEGGLAMGLGFAMFEQIPDDPRNADFMNFHTYRAPRFRTMAPILHTLDLIPLPPGESILTEGQPMARSKGIAEAVMTTVAPALANAIAHASNNYEWLDGVQLPLTRHAVLAALKEAQ